jgi:prepilin-type N-terminal cleavage/methylation domain-containing protein
MKNMKSQIQGFTLLETIVAVSVLALAISGPLTLASYAIHLGGYSQNQITAFYLAEEAVEYIKNKRDNNVLSNADWLNEISVCQSASGCIIDVQNNSIAACSGTCPKVKYDSSTGFYNHQKGSDTVFTRQVNLTYVSDYEEKVTVTLSWNEGLIPLSFTLEENILNWP